MLYNIIKRRGLGRAQSHLGGGAVSPGGTQSHLGATRPRVGICLTRLDALASKYKMRSTLIIVLPSWGIEPQLDNADAGTRRPQVRLRSPQVRSRRPQVRTRPPR